MPRNSPFCNGIIKQIRPTNSGCLSKLQYSNTDRRRAPHSVGPSTSARFTGGKYAEKPHNGHHGTPRGRTANPENTDSAISETPTTQQEATQDQISTERTCKPPQAAHRPQSHGPGRTQHQPGSKPDSLSERCVTLTPLRPAARRRQYRVLGGSGRVQCGRAPLGVLLVLVPGQRTRVTVPVRGGRPRRRLDGRTARRGGPPCCRHGARRQFRRRRMTEDR